jgi:hypothetical protein
MQKSFSKSFSVNLVKRWCMAWFKGLKERKNEKNDYITHTLHIFFLLHTIIIMYSQSLEQGRSFENRSRENFSSKSKMIYTIWKIN